MRRAVPWVVTCLGALWLLGLLARAPHADDPGLAAFARLPVSFEGRLKPLDSVARNALLGIQGKSTLQLEGRRVSAAAWLLDVLARPAVASEYEVFRVDHPDVLALLGRRQETSKTLLSASELRERQQELFTQAQRVSQIDGKQRTGFEVKVLELATKLNLFERLSGLRDLHVVPPLSGEPDWLTIHDVLGQGREARSGEAGRLFASLLEAHQRAEAQAFQDQVERYAALVAEAEPEASRKARLETRFNAFAPFYRSMQLYLLAFLLCLGGWLMPTRGAPQGAEPEHDLLGRTALALTVLGLAVHTCGLIVRVYLMDRPPVTNLYSSAVFVGWGAVIVAIVLERVFRNGVGTLTAVTVGCLSLLVAQGLAADGSDTMAVLQAVLDTNFWLATHVVVITLGYAATFLSGFLGLVFVFKGMLTTGLDRPAARHMTQMIYGIVCFATLFSFVGTILGGIWADQSWGRFWGWDPKENGALLIVLWNAVILHARWGGMVRMRGLAVLAILGNVVTAWSWFGTNMLGVGLHSYGFMDQALFWLAAFVLSQLGVAAVASTLPLRVWRSDFGARTKAAEPVAATPAEPVAATQAEPAVAALAEPAEAAPTESTPAAPPADESPVSELSAAAPETPAAADPDPDAAETEPGPPAVDP